MFDTHQAARLLNLGRHSLDHLLKLYCGVESNKQYQLADWRIRCVPDEHGRVAALSLLATQTHMRVVTVVAPWLAWRRSVLQLWATAEARPEGLGQPRGARAGLPRFTEIVVGRGVPCQCLCPCQCLVWNFLVGKGVGVGGAGDDLPELQGNSEGRK